MHYPHPRRLPQFTYLGPHRYSLRFCTESRSHAFASEAAVALVLAQFVRAAVQTHFVIFVYCFMPDHVHLLVEGGTEAADCRRFINLAKQYSGYYYKRQFGRVLWQRYSFERVLREEEATEVVARYILENPVRAGLVSRAEDYPFMGSTLCSLKDLLEWIAEAR